MKKLLLSAIMGISIVGQISAVQEKLSPTNRVRKNIHQFLCRFYTVFYTSPKAMIAIISDDDDLMQYKKACTSGSKKITKK